jgi:hypothetical protein
MASPVVPWSDYTGSEAEALIAALLVRTIPGAQRIDGSGGDGGVDVRVRQDGEDHVYEIKGFHGRLTSGQKRQISNSLTTAVEHQPAMIRWTLVLPLEFSPAEDRWFYDVLAKKAEIPIDWIGRTQLEERLSQNRDLLRAFAPGSIERRAMDLLGEYNAEKAAMSKGMVDGIERLAGIKSQIDLTDPDYAFDFKVTGENISIDVRPKDVKSARRRPIGVSVEISDNDAAVAGQVEQFLRYGRPVDIPSESIIRFEPDLPGNLNEVLAGDTPSISLRKTDEEKNWRLAQRVEAVRDGRVVGTLSVEWDDRSQGPLGGSWVSGKDRGGFLELTMKTGPDQKGGIDVRAPASHDVLPEDAVPAMRFLSLLKRGDQLRFVAPGHADVEGRLTGDPVGDPDALRARLAVAEALARIQSAAGIRFALPQGWSHEEGQMIYFWDQLLTDGRVQWYWPGFWTNLPAASVRKLLRESALPRISMHATSARDMVAELLGHPLRIQGQIRCEVTNIVISTPLSLAEQVRDLPPDVLVPVPLAQDNRTICIFYLDLDVDTLVEDST